MYIYNYFGGCETITFMDKGMTLNAIVTDDYMRIIGSSNERVDLECIISMVYSIMNISNKNSVEEKVIDRIISSDYTCDKGTYYESLIKLELI